MKEWLVTTKRHAIVYAHIIVEAETKAEARRRAIKHAEKDDISEKWFIENKGLFSAATTGTIVEYLVPVVIPGACF